MWTLCGRLRVSVEIDGIGRELNEGREGNHLVVFARVYGRREAGEEK